MAVRILSIWRHRAFSGAGSMEERLEMRAVSQENNLNKHNVPWTLCPLTPCVSVCVCYMHIKELCVCVFCATKRKTQWGWCSFNKNMMPIKARGGKFMQSVYVQHLTLSRAELHVLTSLLSQKLWLPCYITLHVALPLEREGEGASLKPEPPMSCIMWIWCSSVTKTGNSEHMHL